MGATCITCSERRRDILQSVELWGSWISMCFNCAGLLSRLSPLPSTLKDLRLAIARDRRAEERRDDQIDDRVFQHDRRLLERRWDKPANPQTDTYAMATDPDLEDYPLLALADPMEEDSATIIREAISPDA